MRTRAGLACIVHRSGLPDGGSQVEAVADEARDVALRAAYRRLELRALVEDVPAVGGVGAGRRQLRHEIVVAAPLLERRPRLPQRVRQRRVAVPARLQRRHHRGGAAQARPHRLVQPHLRHRRLGRRNPQGRVQELLRGRHPGQRRQRATQRPVVHLHARTHDKHARCRFVKMFNLQSTHVTDSPCVPPDICRSIVRSAGCRSGDGHCRRRGGRWGG